MKIQSFLLKNFMDNENKVSVDVPVGSIYRSTKIFHDGIYIFFEVPELIVADKTERHTYKLIGLKESIPNNSQFVTILDIIIEMPLEENETVPRQQIQVIPIYKIN